MYAVDADLIPKNTSVVVVRVPITKAQQQQQQYQQQAALSVPTPLAAPMAHKYVSEEEKLSQIQHLAKAQFAAGRCVSASCRTGARVKAAQR